MAPPPPHPSRPYHYSATIELPSSRHAQIVQRATAPDPELRNDVVRDTQVTGNKLTLSFHATTQKALRTSVLSFYDFISISLRTLEQFPPIE